MDIETAERGVPYSIVVPTIYGSVIANRYDINQTNGLIKQGRSPNHQSIELLHGVCQHRTADPFVIDVGANFGLFSLGLAKLMKGRGVYHAFEAQRVIFNMLAGSVALNGYLNIFCHHVAIGNGFGQIEIPQFDYNVEMNFGSIEFAAEQREHLHQQRGQDASRREFVELRSLDSYEFPRADIVKIDVEGMEADVLKGARRLIERHRPVLQVEFIKSDARALHDHISSFGYKIFISDIDFVCLPVELAAIVES